MDNQKKQVAAEAATSSSGGDDQDLDDLLDSALSDFDKAPQPLPTSVLNPSKAPAVGKVSIEKTNLYVDDDMDYEDRPTKVPLPRHSSNIGHTPGQQTPLMPDYSSLLFNNGMHAATGASSSSANTSINDDMKMFEEIFGDEKTKQKMLHLKETLSVFKEGDEHKLLENFDQVMSQIADTFKLDDADEDDDEDLPTDMKEATAMLADLLKSANQDLDIAGQAGGKKPASTTSPSKKPASSSSSSSQPPLNPASFFNAEFLSKLSASSSSDNANNNSENNDELSEAEASMMEPLLSMLFSKEILYPSLKMMLDNFDKYLEDKRATLSAEEVEKLVAQKACIAEMCQIYEESFEGLSEAEAKKRKSQQLKRVIELLEKCGMPPSELVPEVNPFSAMPNVTGGAGGTENCPIQ